MQNAAIGAIKVIGQGHVAALAFLEKVPDPKDFRDMLTHFDDYAIAEGDLRKAADGKAGPFDWMPMWNYDETMAISNRCKGEEAATLYEVPIQTALKATAVLVMAAAAFVDFEPSPTLAKLSGNDGAPHYDHV